MGYLVIGSGSIARRHINNIKQLFPDRSVYCLSSSGRALAPGELGDNVTVLEDIPAALSKNLEFVVVASPAPFHLDHAQLFLEKGIPTLIEKPLSDSFQKIQAHPFFLKQYGDLVDVGYNLRFLPSAQVFKKVIDAEKLGQIHSVLVDVGQYLPDWRPQSDYRKNVSARKDLGGGVLLELSHDLDYLSWIFGAFKTVFCSTRRSGILDIDVEDNIDALVSCQSGLLINMHMDFLQRAPTRRCKVVAQNGTLIWDIINNKVTLHAGANQEEVIYSAPDYNRNEMYLLELNHFVKVINGEVKANVSVGAAAEIVRVVDAMKKSSQIGQVVSVGDV